MTRAHPGRPMDGQITARVLQEARTQLCERGVDGVSVVEIARNLDVSKASVYRRWPSKAALVAELVTQFAPIDDIPDTGDLVSDLVSYKQVHLEGDPALFATDGERAVRAEAMMHPDVLPFIRERMLGQRRRVGRAILSRAAERGEIDPNADIELVLDLLSGVMVFRRAFRMAPIEARDISDSVRIILDGIRIDGP